MLSKQGIEKTSEVGSHLPMTASERAAVARFQQEVQKDPEALSKKFGA